MNDKPNLPRYFRLLEKGETIQKGDCFPRNRELCDNVAVGMKTSDLPDIIYFRPVQVDEWQSYAERKPTKEDFNVTKEGWLDTVMKDGELRIVTDYEVKRYGDQIQYWRRITLPQPAKPKAVDFTLKDPRGYGRQAMTINADGSIKLKCGDVYTAESIEEFIKARNEVMEK